MAATVTRGLNDLKIYPLDEDGELGTAIDQPGAQSLSWSADADSDEVEGDDKIYAKAFGPKSGEATLTVAAVSLPVLAAIQGGTVTTTGTAPNTVSKLDETGQASDAHFALKAQAKGKGPGEAGSAYRVTLHDCQGQSPSEELGQSAWNTPSIGLVFVENVDGKMITREQYETFTALV